MGSESYDNLRVFNYQNITVTLNNIAEAFHANLT